MYEFDDFRLDAGTRLLFRGNKQISLTPRAVETLLALVVRHGEVIRKEELMKRIWADTVVEESNLAQYLHILRKTLGKTPDGRPYIETLKRRGYRFNAAVRVSENRDASKVEATSEERDAPLPVSSSVNAGRSARSVSVANHGQAAHAVAVERSDNVYSVSDWRREPIADTAPPPTARDRSNLIAPIVLIVLGISLAGVAFAVYRYSTRVVRSDAAEVPFRDSEMTRLTTNGTSKRVAVSPDAKYVAHVTGGTGGDTLWVRQVAVANDTRIAGPSPSEMVWVTFAPDGDFLYYLALERNKGDTELFRVPVLGGPVVKVADDVGAPSFSPDGKDLAYMMMKGEETRLIVATVAGMAQALPIARQAPDFLKPNETKLVSRLEPDYLNSFWCAPAWSLDGKTIAFPVAQGDEKGRYETVRAVDVDSHLERKLTDTRWQSVGQPRWLPDGIVVSASETSTASEQLWHISLADGTASRITRDLNNYRDLSLSADTNALAVIQDHNVSNIWTLSGDGSAAKQIMSEAGRFNEIIWLRDGRIAYTSNAGGSSDIWTVNADGSNVRQLTMGANARLGLAATADQKQLVFAAEHDGKFNLWRIDIDGANLIRITDGDGEYYPQCTPDGQWIVYQSGGNYPTLWKMPASGGPGERITTSTASRPSVSPDGKLVAYHYLDSSFEKSRWGIGIIDLESGQRVKRFDFPPTVVERLVKWTRDGKAVAFLNSPGGIPNIWLQPMDGGDPRPLTDFPSDNIIAFNWNADGSQLAVIRGVETSDVLMMNRSLAK
ncbi:MAG: PD40 domain-containing protein [Acidobacteria bacterium]|nr:PD40 domain-containing protein [Acidobacteriota bacterium]